MRRPAIGGRRRQGVALVAALGLLLLAAGLLAGSAVASVELRRATRSLVSAARAESETRRALGEVVQGWTGALDSLPIGGVVNWPVSGPERAGPPVSISVQVQRLTAGLFAASAAVRVGTDGVPLASRRARLVLQRSIDTTGSARAARVAPLARWSFVDVH